MEEAFREAACVGNCETVRQYLNSGVDINSQNSVNGWTALHWAVKRGHKDIVALLIEAGAQQNIENKKGQKPFDLSLNKTKNQEFSETTKSTEVGQEPAFVPNYLKNPIFPYGSLQQSSSAHQSNSESFNDKKKIGNPPSDALSQTQFYFQPTSKIFVQNNEFAPCGLCIIPEKIVFLVRIAKCSLTLSPSVGSDFIEVNLDRCQAPPFKEFKDILRRELNLNQNIFISSIRKLPHTILRSNCDVRRLTDYQMLEVVLKDS